MRRVVGAIRGGVGSSSPKSGHRLVGNEVLDALERIADRNDGFFANPVCGVAIDGYAQ